MKFSESKKFILLTSLFMVLAIHVAKASSETSVSLECQVSGMQYIEVKKYSSVERRDLPSAIITVQVSEFDGVIFDKIENIQKSSRTGRTISIDGPEEYLANASTVSPHTYEILDLSNEKSWNITNICIICQDYNSNNISINRVTASISVSKEHRKREAGKVLGSVKTSYHGSCKKVNGKKKF